MVEPTAPAHEPADEAPAADAEPAAEPADDALAADAPAADGTDATRELPAAVAVGPMHPDPASAPPAAPQTLGILSLVLGIVGLLASAAAFGLVFGIAAVVLGHQSLRREPAARGMALGGLVTGYAAIGVSVIVGIGLLASLLIPLFAIGLFAGLATVGG